MEDLAKASAKVLPFINVILRKSVVFSGHTPRLMVVIHDWIADQSHTRVH